MILKVKDAATITPAYVRAMAGYNSHMNREVYAAAARLDNESRQRDPAAGETTGATDLFGVM